MKTSRLGFTSHDGASSIRALLWQPDKATVAPRAIVQIVHGMSEHVERYEEFARFLTDDGFAVCAEDHIGHGKSAASEADLGHIGLAAGADAMVEDVHELRRMVQSRFSSATPYVLFGHSMGSFMVRAYLTRHAEGLAAAVMCGGGQQPVLLSKAGNALARLLASLKGETYRSKLLDSLGAGAYAKQISNARTDFDWLSVDPAVVDSYIADPLCGKMFTVGGYAALTTLTGMAASPALAAKVPHDLPLLFIAGSEDPVGACGAGVAKAVEEYRTAGVATVDMKLYEGMRHEILNEPGRREVYSNVAAWLAKQGI